MSKKDFSTCGMSTLHLAKL